MPQLNQWSDAPRPKPDEPCARTEPHLPHRNGSGERVGACPDSAAEAPPRRSVPNTSRGVLFSDAGSATDATVPSPARPSGLPPLETLTWQAPPNTCHDAGEGDAL